MNTQTEDNPKALGVYARDWADAGFSASDIVRKFAAGDDGAPVTALSRSAVIGHIRRQRIAHAEDLRDLRICDRIDQGHVRASIARDAGVTLAHVEELAREIRK